MFRGPLTYASTPFEVVDWSLFDVIGVDHYRNSKVGDHRYAETIRRYLGQGKPVVNSEFGHSRYRGDRHGHMELGEVDTLSVALHRIPLAGRLVRPRLKQGGYPVLSRVLVCMRQAVSGWFGTSGRADPASA